MIWKDHSYKRLKTILVTVGYIKKKNSKLKLIKSLYLAILSIDKEISIKHKYKNLINNFSPQKEKNNGF